MLALTRHERDQPFDVQVLAWSIDAGAWREER